MLLDITFVRHPESLINYLLVTIMVLSVTAIFVNYKTIRVALFSITALIILMFDVNLFVLNHLSSKECGFIPFKALLGPLFLFHIKMFNDIKITGRMVLLHSLPAFPLFALFLYLVFATNMADSMFYYYLIILLEGISMLLYGIYALLPRHTEHSFKLRNIIFTCCIAFILDASITIMSSVSVLRTRDFDPYHLHFINNSFYIVTVLLGWIYFFSAINMMINPADILYPSLKQKRDGKQVAIEQPEVNEISNVEIEDSYKKARLPDDVLTAYEYRLNSLMQTDQVYLQNDLTLTQLAKKLKIANHHLTQVLNTRVRLNFYQYLNKYRVAHAVQLIESGLTNTSIEGLAIQCGFNNRTSFNRYFKEITGEQPSAFIKRNNK